MQADYPFKLAHGDHLHFQYYLLVEALLASLQHHRTLAIGIIRPQNFAVTHFVLVNVIDAIDSKLQDVLKLCANSFSQNE
ncbi:unnamed protein product [Adineta steineri]|uniref:Uncharacterized protein n=1 Tax=Adineta steineri TaxID=433720 RepID=A0A819N096_9BILA|nr:unnamed protein product [Adineta steineri]CAF3988514.1 unnamed protein product [Adineta steineri]CAF4085861.1 unnamed protein product [Adineta steineri]